MRALCGLESGSACTLPAEAGFWRPGTSREISGGGQFCRSHRLFCDQRSMMFACRALLRRCRLTCLHVLRRRIGSIELFSSSC